MKQKKLRVLSALAAAALMLTACSGAAGSGSASTGSTSQAESSGKKIVYPALDPVESNVEGAEANDTTYNILGAQAFGINANTEVAEETFAFIAKLTQGEGDALLANESNAIPSDTTNTEWPELLAPVKDVVDNTEHLVNYSADGNSNIAPMLKENALKLYGGTMTPEEFVQAMLDAGV